MSGQAKEGSTSTKKCPATVAAPRKPRPPRARIDGALLNPEFLDHELMDGNTPPRCPVEALKLPRLRRCAFDVSTLIFTRTINPVRTFLQERLDGGIDGYNWKIRFRDSGPFVLKVVRNPFSRPCALCNTLFAYMLTSSAFSPVWLLVLGSGATHTTILLCSTARMPSCRRLAADAGGPGAR